MRSHAGDGNSERREGYPRAAMEFDDFADRAQRTAASYPDEIMEGVDAVNVHRDAKTNPHLPDVLTLGECETSHLSDPSGQEPFRSVIHLYYGSFVAIAKEDPSFDIGAELEETIAHEIQHHVEDRAGVKTLRDEDALFEAHACFRAGLEVPAGWYRSGDPIEPGLWAVDLDLFLELEMRRQDWARLPGTRLALTILDAPFEVDVPSDAEPEEVWTFEGEGLVDGGDEDTDEEGDEDEPDAALDAEDVGLAGALHVVPIVR